MPANVSHQMVELTPSPLNVTDDNGVLATITKKLRQLSVCAQMTPLQSLMPTLHTLEVSLDQALQEISLPPNVLMILPNECSCLNSECHGCTHQKQTEGHA